MKWLAGLLALLFVHNMANAQEICDPYLFDCRNDEMDHPAKALDPERKSYDYLSKIGPNSNNIMIKNLAYGYFGKIDWDKDKNGMFDNIDLDNDGDIDVGPDGDGTVYNLGGGGPENLDCGIGQPALCLYITIFDPITGIISVFMDNLGSYQGSIWALVRTPGEDSKDNLDGMGAGADKVDPPSPEAPQNRPDR